MSKTNRMYKVFMTVMVTIIAGLLLACGVIAIQKSMKLNLSFQANPNFLFEVYIQKEGEGTANLVFRNFEDTANSKEIVMQNGFSTLQSNTLSADGSFFTTYGDEFSIIIANYTTTMGISVSVTSTATIEGGGDGVPAEITAITSSAVKYSGSGDAAEVKFNVANTAVYPQQTLLEITFAELTTLDVSFSGENTSTGNVEATINYGSAYSQTLTAQDGYVFDENITVTGVEEGGYSWTPNGQTGVFTITDWSKVTGPISINVNAVQSGYKITFNANGGSGSMPNATVAEGDSYTLPANTFTNSPHEFISWNTAADGSGTSYVSGAVITSEKINEILKENTIIFYAQWTYTATFVITTGTGYAKYVGFVITNDSELTFSFGTWYELQHNVAPNSTPIADMQSGTDCYYKETYYDTESQVFTSSHQVAPGDFIFIFGNAYSQDKTKAYVANLSEYYTAPSIDCKNIWAHSSSYSDYIIGIEYVMPSRDIQFNAFTSTYIIGSSPAP